MISPHGSKQLKILLLEGKERREELGAELQRAQRAGNLERAAEIQYGLLVQLEKDIAAEDQRLAELQREGSLLSEEVTAEEVAEIVSKWTGVPVSKMMEGEQEKLLRIEEKVELIE